MRVRAVIQKAPDGVTRRQIMQKTGLLARELQPIIDTLDELGQFTLVNGRYLASEAVDE